MEFEHVRALRLCVDADPPVARIAELTVARDRVNFSGLRNAWNG